MWIKRAEWPKPEKKHECPPRLRFTLEEEPEAPSSIWQCDDCGKQWELQYYDAGWAIWSELGSGRRK